MSKRVALSYLISVSSELCLLLCKVLGNIGVQDEVPARVADVGLLVRIEVTLWSDLVQRLDELAKVSGSLCASALH